LGKISRKNGLKGGLGLEAGVGTGGESGIVKEGQPGFRRLDQKENLERGTKKKKHCDRGSEVGFKKRFTVGKKTPGTKKGMNGQKVREGKKRKGGGEWDAEGGLT